MSREDLRKLLGGYATGSLTPEEQEALFTAALDDQELFDELAREESLRQLLRDPAARGELLAALEAQPEPWHARWTRWFGQPMGLAVASLATAAAISLVVWVGMRAPHGGAGIEVAARRPADGTRAEIARQPAAEKPEAQTSIASPAPVAQRGSAGSRESTAPAANPNSPVGGSGSAGKGTQLGAGSVRLGAEASEVRGGVVGGVPGGSAGGPPQTAQHFGSPLNVPAVNQAAERTFLPEAAPKSAAPAPATELPRRAFEATASSTGKLESANAPMAPPPPPPPIVAEPRMRGRDEVSLAKAADSASKESVTVLMNAALADARQMFEETSQEHEYVSSEASPEGATSGRMKKSRLAAPDAAADRAMRSSAPPAKPAAPSAEPMPAGHAMAPHLGLRYLLPLRSTKGRASADVVLEANDAGYLYVIERAESGAWTPIFSSAVKSHARYTVLRAGAAGCRTGATRELYAILSRRADPALVHLEPRALEERLGANLRKLAGDDGAIYAANSSAQPESQLVGLPITLRCP